jgi:hypothetical protein
MGSNGAEQFEVINLEIADFDAYVSTLSPGAVTRSDLCERTETVQRPPQFVLGTMPNELSLPLAAEFVTGPIRLYSLRDACMTVDGIVIHGATAFSSVMFNHPDYHVANLVAGVLGNRLSLPIRRVEEQAVMLSGPGYTIYGHWLVDILPRLWVLKQCGLDPSKMRYIVPEQSPPFLLPLLSTFGIGGHQLITYNERTEIIQAAELLLPTNLRRASRLHASMKDARDYLMERAFKAGPIPKKEGTPRRVFISRRNSDPSRSLINRVRIEELAQEHGFALVRPEEMTIPEQIGLFRSVREVAGEYGSGLHNTLFSEPGTAVCALRGTSAHPGFIQSGISDVCKQHTGYVLGATPIEAIHHSFEVSEKAFRLALRYLSLLSRSR